MTFNVKIGIFYGFFGRFQAATQNHSQGGAMLLAVVA